MAFRCKLLLLVILCVLCLSSVPVFAAEDNVPYQPNWESLRNYEAPEWWRDAKFGIYTHWGPYCVPAYRTEWYSCRMYQKGHPIYKYHVEHYGHPSEFGYKDFIPKFTAENFDADAWADLFKRAGAQFAGPVAEHADGFALWDSEHTRWDAAEMGPKRDVVGELARAIRKRDMKFVATLHHGWNWGWYPTWSEEFDCHKPEYRGLYGPHHPKDAPPNEQFFKGWLAKTVEVVDEYQPDVLWFDSKLGTIGASYRQRFLAHFYNSAREWGREVVVTYKNEDLPKGTAVLDIERGSKSELTPYTWLTDTSVDRRSWCHIQDPDYKTVNTLIDSLVDRVSKNGNLLLNVGPKPDGTIPEPVRERLLGMGRWLDVNGEAIYGTRPWKIYGEGPTKIKGGMFGERKKVEFTAKDVRFTTREGNFYAICLGWPGEELKIDSLKSDATPKEISRITMLGAEGELEWSRGPDGLTVDMPKQKPCKHTFALKIEWAE